MDFVKIEYSLWYLLLIVKYNLHLHGTFIKIGV